MNDWIPRDKELKVSYQTLKRLRWVCQNINGDMPMSDPRRTHADAIGEKYINECLERDYPNLPKMEKRMKALEDQMISELGEPTTNNEQIQKEYQKL